MITTQLTLDDIIQMTVQVGEDWAIAHVRRLMELVKQISGDLPYDAHVMELAAYMHDWGAFPVYFQRDVEHAVRSRQVVESDILPHLPLTADQKETLLETIELHDYRDLRPTQSDEGVTIARSGHARVPRHDGHGTRIRPWTQERGNLLQAFPLTA